MEAVGSAIFLSPGIDISQLVKNAVEIEPNDCDIMEAENHHDTNDFADADSFEIKSMGATVEEKPARTLPTSSGSNEVRAETNLSPSHLRRKRKRESEANTSNKRLAPSKVAIERHLKDAVCNPLATSLRVEDLPTTSCGYQALNMPGRGGAKPATLDEILRKGYELIENDGYSCRPLVGAHDKVYAVIAGQPRDPSYADDCRKACEFMLAEAKAEVFQKDERIHKRGRFPVINVGVTYSKGMTEPKWLKTPGHENMVDQLLANPSIQRLVRFADASFRQWAPRLYKFYEDHNDALFKARPLLRRIFGGLSVFTSAAFNFGPRVATVRHRDSQNLPFGWCSIQALGDFNPKTGGHMILDDVKKVIEFPSGSLIFIPSATVAHRNTAVKPNETRLSFTQYCAGGIFRYVDNGFRTEGEMLQQDPEAHAEMIRAKETRWEFGISLWSSLKELVQLYSPSTLSGTAPVVA